MKPKQLKHHFSWEERRVHIEDRVWYVPDYYDKYEEFEFPGWDDQQIFGNEKPVRVEYCSGNGNWVAAKALEQPEYNWIGVEKQFDRARKIWSKIKNSNIENLMTLCGEAYISTRHYFPSESVNDIYINFPDPWPKGRHAKNRLVRPDFVHEMWRTLVPNGTVTFVTDDPVYSDQAIRVLLAYKGFESTHPSPYYVTSNPGYGTSFFEDLWRSEGKIIRYHCFQKVVK